MPATLRGHVKAVSAKSIFRNALEFLAIFLIWEVGRHIVDRYLGQSQQPLLHPPLSVIAVVLGLAWAKTAFFGVENIKQLRQASDENWPYHRFIELLLVNMFQIVVSFGLDFHVLDHLSRESFAGVRPELTDAERVFEFFYFSGLNFMFFGYGDITPQTIPAKLLTLTEIALAFVTVIFLLSDFIALKESLRKKPPAT